MPALTQAPLPGPAHPSSSSPSAPREFPSGPAQGRAVLCAVDMENDPNAAPQCRATSRTRSCAAGLRSAPPPSVRHQRSERCFASAPPHLKPFRNDSLAPPILCRSILTFRPTFGPVSVQFLAHLTLNSPETTIASCSELETCRNHEKSSVAPNCAAVFLHFGPVFASFGPLNSPETTIASRSEQVTYRNHEKHDFGPFMSPVSGPSYTAQRDVRSQLLPSRNRKKSILGNRK